MFDFPNTPAVGQVFQPASGPSWQWDGTTWKSALAQGETAINCIFVPGGAAAVNYTYNKPANLRFLEVEGVAAGGSGGSALATAASNWALGSSGGGGSWGKKTFPASAVPASVACVIGAPGAASSSGNGLVGDNTTLAALGLTLYGGAAGRQGANVTYTAGASAAQGSGITAMPVGWDVAKPGESSEGTSVGFNTGGATNAVWAIGGRAGGSPWGSGIYGVHGTGWASSGGIGYGWGSGGNVNAGSGALKNSVPGGPGALMFTEYLAVAPADVLQPARQVFKPTGSAGQIVPVPPTAKMAKVSGTIYMTGAGTPYLRFSIDGSTFVAGASDYAVGGFNSYAGSTGAPVKQPFTTTNAYTLCPGTDSTVVPMMFDADIVVGKGANAQVFGCMSRGFGYNSAATTLLYEYYWSGYGSAGVFQTVSQMAAFLILPSANGFAAGTLITVDWIY